MESLCSEFKKPGLTNRLAIRSKLSMQQYGENDTSRLALRTLGPASTSSAYCAEVITNAGALQCREIILHATFNEILEIAEGDGHSVALVPNAYAGISDFYMSLKLSLLASLVLDTPPYGIAAKNKENIDLSQPNKGKFRVSTHPAPARLISQLLPPGVPFEVVNTCSTAAAAEQVASGYTDLCLSNINAIHNMGLQPVTEMRPITMLWSVFSPTHLVCDNAAHMRK